MVDVNVNTGGAGSSYGSYTPGGAPGGSATADANVTAAQSLVAKDTILYGANSTQTLVAEGQLKAAVNYQASLSQPALPNPVDPQTLSSLFLTNPANTANPDGTGTSADPQATQEDAAFSSSFMSHLTELSAQNGLTPDQTAQVKYAYYHPEDADIPQNLKDIATQVTQDANADVQAKFNLPSTWQDAPDTASFDAQVGIAYQSDLNSELSGYATTNNLSPEDVANVIFALNHPGDPSISADTAKIVATLQADTMTDLQTQYNLPSTMQPPAPNSDFFDQQISSDFGNNFQELLQNYTPPLTEAQQNRAVYIFNNPDAALPTPAEGQPDLASIVKSLSAQAQTETSAEDGLPANYNLTPDSSSYNGVLNAAYADDVRSQISALTPPLSSADQDTLMQLLMGQLDPDSPQVPPNLKSLVSGIKSKAQKNIEKMYAIPAGNFTPDPTKLAAQTFQLPQGLQQASTLLKNMQGMLQGLKSTLNQMPPGADKAVFADYLKAVSTALNNLRNVLYTVEQADSALSSQQSNSSLQLSQDKIAIQTAQTAAQLKAIQDQPKPKGGALGGLMNFFQKLGPVFSTIMAFVFLGPAAGVFMALDAKFGLIAKITSAVANVVGTIAKDCGASDKVVSAMETTAKFMTIAVAFAAMGPTGATALMVIGPQVLQESGVITDVVSSFVSDPQQAKMISMYITMALTAAVAVAQMCIPIPGPDVAALIEGATQLLVDTAETLAETLPLVSTALRTMALVSINAAETVEKVSTTISEMVDSSQQYLKTFCQVITGADKGVEKLAEAYPAAARTAIDSFADGCQSVIDSLKAAAKDAVTNPMTVADGIQVAGNIEGGIFDLKLAAYDKNKAGIDQQQAMMQAEIDMLTSMMQTLTKIMSTLLDNLSGVGTHVDDINTAVLSLYQGAESAGSQLWSGGGAA